MKICLYSEFYKIFGGTKNIGSGFISALENQKLILNNLNIPFVEKWDNSCDILQVNTPWPKSLLTIKKVKRLGKKTIIWSHVTLEDSLQVFRFVRYIAPLYRAYLKYGYGLADIILSPSHYTKRLLISYGLPAEKIIVQSNGVDLTKFFPDQNRRNEFRTDKKMTGLSIGCVALAIPRKGLDTFFKLADKFPNYNFHWFGKIFNKTMAKGLPKVLPKNVFFSGFVPDVLAAFNATDIFLFPSYEENQGMVLLEAAAVGLPILCRDIPAYEGWMIHNVNCLKAKTDEEFEKYLGQLLTDEGLRARLSQETLVLAKNESLPVLAQKLKLEYDRLLNK
jgi:1,2-diacylglycerol-3-alpha-glucose alpha-1,2-glucosyltransferase